MSPTLSDVIQANGTVSRAAQISQIIQKRRPLAQKIETVEANLKALSTALQQLERQRDRLLEKISDLSTTGKLREIDFATLQRGIEAELATLVNLKSRFSRNTLNIGVVGRARQGKSRLLQSLTGLSASEIPDGDAQHCTGVRSDIHHNPDIGEAYAEVWFHTERSFLDKVIAPYYEQLCLGSRPYSIQEFADRPLPTLSKEIADKRQAAAKYEHLCRYYHNFDQYRHVLTEPSPRRISRHEIREYVAQDTADGKRIYFNYLAVQKVKITCCFPNADIGQIALIDMPGLGDTGIGDEERMIQTLGQDIDLVLFVRMPKPNGDFWAKEDVELYDMANSALGDLPVQEWSFMVLNRISGTFGNQRNCENLAAGIAEKHIDVRGVVIADCTSSEETKSTILDRVLSYLGQRIELLDRQYASACQDRLIQLQRSVCAELGKAKTAWLVARDDWFSQFLKLFGKFWNDISRELECLIASTIVERDADDENFRSAVNNTIAICREDSGIPSLVEIQKKCFAQGANMAAYAECLHEVRTHLSKQFLPLDFALKNTLESAKSRVVDVFKNWGKLGRLVDGEGSVFLSNLTEKIPENLKGLRLGFQTLATFDLQYRGLIQHRIRKHLDVLIPNRTPYTLDADLWDVLLGKANFTPSEKIMYNLRQAQAEAVNNCEKELTMLLKEPSQASFAIVEEFVDRVLRSEDVREEWQIFLQEFAEDIWVEEFRKMLAQSQLRRDWVQGIEQVETIKHPDALNFLR